MKKKPKTVKAWAFSYRSDARVNTVAVRPTRKDAVRDRSTIYEIEVGCIVGPIVRIEVPAPKEAKP